MLEITSPDMEQLSEEEQLAVKAMGFQSGLTDQRSWTVEWPWTPAPRADSEGRVVGGRTARNHVVLLQASLYPVSIRKTTIAE